MATYMKEHGNLPDRVADEIFTNHGLEVAAFHIRSPDDTVIENQAVNRQRVLWLNNEGYLRDMQRKKLLMAESAAAAARRKQEEQDRKETERLAKEEQKRQKAAQAEQKKLEKEEAERKIAEARLKAAQEKIDAPPKVRYDAEILT